MKTSFDKGDDNGGRHIIVKMCLKLPFKKGSGEFEKRKKRHRKR